MSALTTIDLPGEELADPQTVLRHLRCVKAEHGYVPARVLDYWRGSPARKCALSSTG